MVQSNKILTVSYGTFSCTLEGFDDSFGTMKAIAEYFRDLASDDRYFGAEPPVPEADMLARIAQREISRKVEASRDSNGGFVLRADERSAALASPAEDAVAEPQVQRAPHARNSGASQTTVPTVAACLTRDPRDEADSETVLPPLLAAPSLAEAMALREDALVEDIPAETVAAPRRKADSIAARLDRIRAVVAKSEQPAAEASPETIAGNDATPDPENDPAEASVQEQVASDQIETGTEVGAEAQADEPDSQDLPETAVGGLATGGETADTVETDEQHPDNDMLSSVAETCATADEPTATDDVPMEPGPDSLVAEANAAAVASETGPQPVPAMDAAHPEPDDSTEDPHQAETSYIRNAGPDAPVSEDKDASRHSAGLQIEPQNDRSPDHTDPENASDEEAVARLPEPEALVATENTDDAVRETVTPDDKNPIANDGTDTDDAPTFGSGDIPVLGTEPSATGPDAAADEPTEADQGSQVPTPQVVKVRRTDLDALLAEDELEDAAVASEADQAQDTEREDALTRELARIEATITGDFTDSECAAEEQISASSDTRISAEDLADEARDDTDLPTEDANTHQKVCDADADLARLMSAIDDKMASTETTSAHETHSQLRAAVAVSEEDTETDSSTEPSTPADAFRQDLEQAVRPRRPVSGAGAAGKRASEQRPAPLKLVAEQRVDTLPAALKQGPVRPRRISAEEAEDGIEDTETVKSFADFATRMNAKDLPDLLEAAAAYLVFVEGRAQFSRPQLMNRVRQIDAVSFDREAGLRSFGRLLKEGKIEKSGGGRFTAAEDISFHPDPRGSV